MAGEKKNRHLSKFMTRLPEAARVIVEQFKQEYRRPYTETIMLALEEYRDRHGKKNKSRKTAGCG